MRPLRLPVSLGSVALATLFASSAAAQDATPPAAPAAPAPAAAAPAGATPLEDQGRLWIGFNVNGGVGTGANLSGPAFGGTFRIGYSIDHLMGVYANISPIVWAASASNSSINGASVSLSAIDGVLLSPMFALTPVDLFEVAAGPSVDYLSGGSASVNGQSSSANAFSSAYFGIDGRIALHLGGRNPDTGRRRGFTISGDVHPSFVSGGPITFITAGLGADWY